MLVNDNTVLSFDEKGFDWKLSVHGVFGSFIRHLNDYFEALLSIFIVLRRYCYSDLFPKLSKAVSLG